MRGRCANPNDSDFKDYGGRGIQVCARWSDFAAFVEDMGRKPPNLTLDRIDVNGHYEPANCRWASQKTQANNKRSNRVIEHQGERKTLQEWADLYEIDHSKLWYRLKVGYPIAEALSDSHDFRRRKHSTPISL
jgi:hypothetical protein